MEGTATTPIVVVVFCLNILVASCGVLGQSLQCVPFTGSPATEHKCDQFLEGRNILLQTSFEETDTLVGEYVKQFGATVPYVCRNYAIQLICITGFPTCDFTTTLSVLFPCRSMCEETVIQCLPFLASANATVLLPNCNAVISLNNQAFPQYPPDGLSPCRSGVTTAVVPYMGDDCPYPLVFDPDQFTESYPFSACQLTCPAYAFGGGPAQFSGAVAALYLATFPSVICSFLMILTWGLNPVKRRYPAVLILWLTIAAFGQACMLSMSILIGGPENTICTWSEPKVAVTMENAHENGGQGVVCIMQAIGSYYFGLASSFWWFSITINIFLMLCFPNNDFILRNRNFLHLGYHIFSWGLPIVGLIIVLSMKKFGSYALNPFCGVLYPQGETWVDWAFYSGPILGCIVFGTTLMAISITRFAIVQLRYEKSRWSELIHLVRLVVMVIFTWLNFVFYLIYRVYLEVHYNDLYSDISVQVLCSIATETDCPFNTGFNYPLYIIAIIAIASVGVCIFLTMCTTRSSVVLWWRILSGLKEPQTFMHHTLSIVRDSSSSAMGSTTDQAASTSNPGEAADNSRL